MAASNTAVTRDYGKRVVIITGSSRGIGKAIAIRLAQDGFSVCINDIAANEALIESTVSEIKALGRECIGVVADVTQKSEVEAMIVTSVEKLGPLNVMIANAGIVHVENLIDVSEEEVRKVFDVNVFGLFNCYQAAAKQMIKQGGGGKILGAASVASYKPTHDLCPYTASKFAVRGFTQGFALELAKHQITVNGYAPGIVDTPMWDKIDKELGKKTGGLDPDARMEHKHKIIALGRTSVPEDVAKCVSYLASPDSDYMTGQTLLIDGGMVMN